MNPSVSSSKTLLVKKCSPAPKFGQRQKQSARNPLKDANGSTSASSSTASSVSIEAPKGCLRFFLSNNSSSSSRTPLHRRPKTLSKTPRSAPNARPSKEKEKENLSKPKPHKSNKNPPCLYQWQSAKRPTFTKSAHKPKPSPPVRTNDSGISAIKLASGSQQLKQQQQKPTELGIHGNNGNFTPVSKFACGSVLDCTFDKAKAMDDKSNTNMTTPPVEASVSPEIQCGSSAVTVTLTTTPACYGAGHVVSGVTDKRKCRPRGILIVGENGLDFGKANTFDYSDDENVERIVVKSSKHSMIPLPPEASMKWLLSPCDEEREDSKALSDNGSRQCPKLVGSIALHSSSPSSGHGFSSDVCDSSNNTSNTTNTNTATCTSRRSRNSLLSPTGRPDEFQACVEPPSDNMAGCSLSSSPHEDVTPRHKDVVSQEEKKCRYNFAEENSAFSMESLVSGNVMQTPQSDSSSDRHVGLVGLKAVDCQKSQFESELDSVAEVLQMTSFSPNGRISMWNPNDFSFQFDPLTTCSNSIDFIQLQNNWDNQASWISNSTLENVSQSQMRISWREGLVSRIFEMDELDCCRCLSDEEEDAESCDKSHGNLQLNDDDGVGSDRIIGNHFRSSEFFEHEPKIDEKGKRTIPPQKPSSCAESISVDGDGLVASQDSDWTLCYKNQLFQV